MLRTRSSVALLIAALTLAPSVVFAQTLGGYAMTLSNNAACIGDATCTMVGTNQVAITGPRLELVNGQYGTTGTAFTTAAQNLSSSSAWATSFTFGLQFTDFDPQADGFAFVLQSVGPSATGNGGGGIGIDGLSNSAAVGFRSWDNNDVFVSTNGAFGPSTAHLDWGTAQLVTGSVNLAYNGLGMIDITMTSSLGDVFQSTQSFDMSGLTPGSVYLGFTAGTGLSTQYAYIEDWRFTSSTVPEPASIALVGAGMLALAGVAYRRRER